MYGCRLTQKAVYVSGIYTMSFIKEQAGTRTYSWEKDVNGIGPSYIIFLIYVRRICVVQGINPLSVQAFIVAH
jgi:hypothetical protein